MAASRLYDGQDPRAFPAYGLTEAARYLRIPAATLRSWVVGRTYPVQDGVGSFEPLIRPADAERRRLSFENLVEAHVLRGLRTQHSVDLKAFRPALEYAEKELGIERLLLNNEPLLTYGGQLFLERFGDLVNLSRAGQIAIRSMLIEHLKRVERDDAAIPIRLYPFLASELTGARSIVIDPRRSFGRPTVGRRGDSHGGGRQPHQRGRERGRPRRGLRPFGGADPRRARVSANRGLSAELSDYDGMPSGHFGPAGHAYRERGNRWIATAGWRS